MSFMIYCSLTLSMFKFTAWRSLVSNPWMNLRMKMKEREKKGRDVADGGDNILEWSQKVMWTVCGTVMESYWSFQRSIFSKFLILFSGKLQAFLEEFLHRLELFFTQFVSHFTRYIELVINYLTQLCLSFSLVFFFFLYINFYYTFYFLFITYLHHCVSKAQLVTTTVYNLEREKSFAPLLLIHSMLLDPLEEVWAVI